ncbi:MAG: SHOCT domain-containing protein [Chitinophagaceae bacterium]|nr:SHOCT domain-containing protein [Chitinophagaceae bacterium]
MPAILILLSFIKAWPKTILILYKTAACWLKNLKAYKYSGADNNSIRITGTITYKDGKKEEADILVNFERATQDYDGQPSELNIPEQLKAKPNQPTVKAQTKQPAAVEPQKQSAPDDLRKILVADEIKKLFDLYKAGALTKEEYEAQKKKLLERQ